jgi:hypothetical protein
MLYTPTQVIRQIYLTNFPGGYGFAKELFSSSTAIQGHVG